MTEPAAALAKCAIGKVLALLVIPQLLVAGVASKPNALASQASP